MRVFEISPLVSSRLGVFPGDQPFQFEKVLDFSKGHHLQLGRVTTTLHLGAHADSTSHYSSNGEGVETRDLQAFMGPCQVIRVRVPRAARIQPEDLAVKIQAPRVLFSTGSFPDPENWNSDFSSLSPLLIEFLAEQGVRLVGLDTPSVDPENSKDLPSHQALYRTGLAVLEGLVLEHVPEGLYTLVALPLRLEGADASPVRAILLEGSLQDLDRAPWNQI